MNHSRERGLRHLARTVLVALSPLLGLFVTGCTSIRYVPEIPLRARSGDATLEMKALRVGRSRSFVYEVQSTTSREIGGAWLTVATRDPCTDGAVPSDLTIDEKTTRMLPSGVHEIELRFGRGFYGMGGMDDFDADLVVDLAMKDGLCVRAPAVSRSVRMEAEHRPLLVVATGVLGNAGGVPMPALLDVRLGVARWMGRSLLSAEAGPAVVSCRTSLCNSSRTGWAVPVVLDLRSIIGNTAHHHTMHLALLGVSYSYVQASLPTLTGDRFMGMHFVHGTLSGGGREIPLGPFRNRERGGLFEYGVRLGVMIDSGFAKAVFSGGAELRLLTPL